MRAIRVLAACLLLLAAVFAGVGVLYLLRDAGMPRLGPRVQGALPLQQLAGGAAQPLDRIVLAWLPAGLIAGLALGVLTRLSVAWRSLLSCMLAALLLLFAGAASDAVTRTEPLGPHLEPQLTRAGIWAAVVVLGVGALGAPLLARLGRIRI